MQTNVQIDSRTLRSPGRGSDNVFESRRRTLKELVAASPKQMNWRGILIALLVIVAVLGLIVFSIVLLSPPDEGPRVKGRKFSLDDVLGPHFRAPTFNGTWVSGVEMVYRDALGGVSLLNAENLTTRVLVANATFRQLNAVDFKISSDLKFALLISDVQKVYKYSFLARYSIYEIETRNKYVLGEGEGDTPPLLQHVTWAPRGDALVYVRDNDLYYRPRAKGVAAHRLTRTGAHDRIFNGVPDWLYEVELLKSPGAVWFSPDSRYLLFASFNDSLVGEVKYPCYGSSETRLRYPKIRTLRYPKTSTANPAVTLRVADLSRLEDAKPVDLRPPTSLGDALDHYFTAVKWLNGHRAAVLWMNRRQNLTIISVCAEPLWACEDTHAESWGDTGWADAGQAPLFSADGRSYLALLPVLDADNGRFAHACLVDVASRQATPVTHGAYQVTRLLAWDEDHGKVYFLAAPEHMPGQRHLYRIGDLNSTDQAPECLTCPRLRRPVASGTPPHSNETGEAWPGAGPVQAEAGPPPLCLYNDAHFSPGLSPRYLVLECLGPDTPTAELVDLASSSRLLVLDQRDQLRQRYLAMARPQVKTFQVELKGGYHAQVRLHLPPGHREHEQMVFPLVLHVCAAPGSQLVSERWTVDWGTYLASARNFIVAQIDGRGSGYQGERLLHQLRHRLGSVEVEDQVTVIRYLRDLQFVDKQKVAVWGWGYGGFATAMILSEDKEIFKCGISVAPITSWLHYDTAYTERYMGLPNVTDNYLGYEQADLTRRAADLRGRQLLLVHGTADDEVHYQQGMLLARALTEEGVLFRQLTYPDEGHTFSGVQNHLYKAMEAFLDECFGPLDFEEWEVGTSFFSFKQ